MNKLDNLLLSAICLINLLSHAAIAQTNVSGGIYTNTTWTLANSPYIVVDTVAVFPGVTLTIEPGVVVKFENNKRLEIRQAALNAIGTATDSITFTSNSPSPVPGIWSAVLLNQSLPCKFNYCNFSYAQGAIDFPTLITGADSLHVNHSTFLNNITGLRQGFSFIDSCLFENNTTGIDQLQTGIVSNSTIANNQTGANTGWGAGVSYNNCLIHHNQTGILGSSGVSVNYCVIDSNVIVGLRWTLDYMYVMNCNIRYNGIGCFDSHISTNTNIFTQNIIENNDIGLKIQGYPNSVFCNKICGNTTYGFSYEVLFGNNINISNNYWCTNDSSLIAASIYDGYDNISYGLVNFMPIDTLQCYLNTSINEFENQSFDFVIFPNPAFNNLTLLIPNNVSKVNLKIFNVLGELEYSSIIIQPKTNINVSTLAAGIHILEITDRKNISRRKFIEQKNIR